MENGEGAEIRMREVVDGCNFSKHVQGSERYVALDSEMVTCRVKGRSQQVAGRVAIVDSNLNVLFDSYIKPPYPIISYNTEHSGLRGEDLENAPFLHDVRKRVQQLLQGRVLIGHALHNDFKALQIMHPFGLTLDTQRHPFLQNAMHTRQPGLKRACKQILGLDIQSDEHCPVEDARATMTLGTAGFNRRPFPRNDGIF
eukprot:1746394-Rhodomonas_salina.1